MSQQTIAKKLTLGGINNVKKGFKNVTEPRFVARIYGVAASATVEDGTMGQYKKFSGQFKGINEDGEVTLAPVCYLPGPADDLLFDAIRGAEGKPVEFGFDFWVYPNPDAVLGYEYKVKPAMEVQTAAPLEALENKFTAPPPAKKAPALAAPAENAAAPAPAVEEPAQTPVPAPAKNSKK